MLYIFYASEVDCEESDVEHKPEPGKSKFSDLVAEYKEILASMRKLLASYAAKVDLDSEPSALVEPDIIDKPESEAVNEPQSEPKVIAKLVPL